MTKKPESKTCVIFYCRYSAEINDCSPLHLLNGLIDFKPAIAYFAYTYLYRQY